MSNLHNLDELTKAAISTFLRYEAILNKTPKIITTSKKTRGEYVQLSKYLMQKRANEGSTLFDVVMNTSSKNTYFKRIASLKLFILQVGIRAINTLIETSDTAAIHNIKVAADDITALSEIIDRGFKSDRSKRKSKRLALKGLPSDWRERICNFNLESKYRLPMLVAALTGCRPAELEKGVCVRLKKPAHIKGFIVEFEVSGAKVSDQKGQEIRRITYAPDTKNKLLSDFLSAIDLFENKEFQIIVKNAANFSKEITRIAKLIWPAHKEDLSAYCFRHQFSSDLKKHYSGDDVSLALGHASSKTRKIYGSASQSRGAPPLLSVSASREVKVPVATKRNESSEP